MKILKVHNFIDLSMENPEHSMCDLLEILKKNVHPITQIYIKTHSYQS